MVNVIRRREGRIIEYDITKITDAITKAFIAVEGISEMAEEVINSLTQIAISKAHSLAHWAFHTFFKIKSRIKKVVSHDPYMIDWVDWLTTVISILVKILTTSFLEHAHVFREIWVNRSQDRSADDDSDSDANKLVFTTIFLTESL